MNVFQDISRKQSFEEKCFLFCLSVKNAINLFRIFNFLVFISKMKRNARMDTRVFLICLQNVDIIGGSWSYLIDLKLVFCPKFWEFTERELK